MSTHTSESERDAGRPQRRSSEPPDETRESREQAREDSTWTTAPGAQTHGLSDGSSAAPGDGATGDTGSRDRLARLQQAHGNRAIARAAGSVKDGGSGGSVKDGGSGMVGASRGSGGESSPSLRNPGGASSPPSRDAGGGTRGSSASVSTPQSREPPVVSGRGTPLGGETRSFFESRFDRSLDNVRLHTGPSGSAVARSLDASAVTRGSDIYFDDGAYRPDAAVGRGLLAHELTHAVQQSDAGGAQNATSVDVLGADHPMERDATSVSRRLARGVDAGPVSRTGTATPVLARQASGEQSPPVTFGPFTPEYGQEQQSTTGPTASAAGQAQPGGGTTTGGGAALDLQGSANVSSSAIASRLPADAEEGRIPVRFGGLASGEIEVVKQPSGEYSTPKKQPIPLAHPGLAPLQEQDVSPALVVDLTGGSLSGFVSLTGGQQNVLNQRALFSWIRRNPGLMGWAGLDGLEFPGVTNTIEGGELVTKVEGMSFTVGGFLDGTGSFGLVGNTVVFDAASTIDVTGLEPTQLTIQRTRQGTLAGSAEVGVAFDTFSGTVLAEFGNGTVSMEGTATYTGEKFDGSVTFLVTQESRAKNLARERLGPDAVQQSAKDAEGEETEGASEPAVGPQPGPRAVAGYGTVNVNLTDWLAGSAEVIVDARGNVTVVGEVSPPAEVTLFEQKDYVHEFPRVEVKAIYGIPVVGNVNLFANIGVDAIAKLGPGTLYDIVLDGTYSTDPRVYQNYSLAATLNVSAFAGVRIRAEGGAGITIIAHDIKAGVGIEGTAGIEGYVEARPTIGYREQAAPKEGKTGEFFIAGHMEIAAQPAIVLAGDLFVELDSPWASPAPDKTWDWPVGELRYPLPGEFGIGADVDYVLGSGKVPDIEFGAVDFDSDKFMSDLMNDNVKKGGGGKKETQGTFKDEGEKADKPQVGGKKSKGNGKVAKKPTKRGGGKTGAKQPGKAQQTGDEGDVPSSRVEKQWQGAMREMMELKQESRNNPLDETELEAELARIRRKYSFSTLRVTRRGSDWKITYGMNPKETLEVHGPKDTGTSAEEKIKKVMAGREYTEEERVAMEKKLKRQTLKKKLHRHHLVPYKFVNDKKVSDQFESLGVNVREFVNNQIVEIPRLKHGTPGAGKSDIKQIHTQGDQWMTEWDRWFAANPDFTMRDVERQIKQMMKDYNIAKSARNWQMEYDDSGRQKKAVKAKNFDEVMRRFVGNPLDSFSEAELNEYNYTKYDGGTKIRRQRGYAVDSMWQKVTVEDGTIEIWGELE